MAQRMCRGCKKEPPQSQHRRQVLPHPRQPYITGKQSWPGQAAADASEAKPTEMRQSNTETKDLAPCEQSKSLPGTTQRLNAREASDTPIPNPAASGYLADYCRRRGLYVERIKAWREACELANGSVKPTRTRREREEEKPRRSASSSWSVSCGCGARMRRWRKPRLCWCCEKKPMRSGGRKRTNDQRLGSP